MMFLDLHHNDRGFTLIEVVASIGVFAIITLALVPLLNTSLKGALLSRTFSSEKSLAQGAVEYVRGLPYFNTGVTRTDVLDLYFPDLNAGGATTTPEAGTITSGYNSSNSTYTTTCTSSLKLPSASGPAACPHNLPNGAGGVPSGTTFTYVAQFLDRSLNPVAPPTGYSYASASTAPQPLMKLVVTAYWKVAAHNRQFSLTTLIGARKLNTETVKAEGNLDYLVQIITGYNDADGSESSLTATLGSSDSQMSTKAISSADSSVSLADATLTQADFGSDQATTAGSLSGAETAVGAPPNATAGPITNGGGTLLPPAGFFSSPLAIAGLSANRVTTATTQINNNLPQSSGAFTFDNSGTRSFWVTNQNSSTSYMLLDPVQPMIEVDRGLSTRSSGNTSASSTSVTPAGSRKVESAVTASMPKISVLPTGFICASATPDPTCSGGDRSVVVISDFSASLNCRSTTSSSTTAAIGSWSATLKYWDGTQNKYISQPLSGAVGSSAADPVSTLKSTNPIVLDNPGTTDDVHLFDTGSVKGYLKDLTDIVNIPATQNATYTNTSVSLTGAIQIVTMPTDPSLAGDNPTGINVTIGSLSCSAKDARG